MKLKKRLLDYYKKLGKDEQLILIGNAAQLHKERMNRPYIELDADSKKLNEAIQRYGVPSQVYVDRPHPAVYKCKKGIEAMQNLKMSKK